MQIANDLESRETQSRLKKHDGVTTIKIRRVLVCQHNATRKLKKSVRLTAEARFDSDHQQSCKPRCKQKKGDGAIQNAKSPLFQFPPYVTEKTS